ncbi:unnamed protein product [Clonostachys solani]|uniref:Amino acid permease/ SLC12A domain-containing protein n=1 Tax=Clonostachys solani TaxID=160281 RepID=A0A9N9W6H3_9HYPO|nr:unnamed protein product [Clonostachys solani]
MPVRIYAETEFWFASIKVIMIIGLLLLSIILALGGGPNGDRIGFRYWSHPGAMNEYLVGGAAGRFCAFIYSLTFSVFSFNFGAAKTFIWRLITFYILGALAIGIICRSDAQGLTAGGYGAAASPWVIAIKQSGIQLLYSVINAGIICSAWSSGNSYLFMSSRSLYSLSVSGNAPAVFQRCTKYGIPIYAIAASSLFGLLAYLNVSSSSSLVFNWFINLTNTAGFTSWTCCGIILLRFRKACKAQGITNLPFQSRLHPYAAWGCICIFSTLLLLNGFSVFFPGHWSVSSFLTAYLGFPVFLTIYFAHRIWDRKSKWLISPNEVDLTSGLDAVLAAEETEEVGASRGKLTKLKAFLF